MFCNSASYFSENEIGCKGTIYFRYVQTFEEKYLSTIYKSCPKQKLNTLILYTLRFFKAQNVFRFEKLINTKCFPFGVNHALGLFRFANLSNTENIGLAESVKHRKKIIILL